MKRSLLALTLLAAIPALAMSASASAAEGLSYTYVEGGYKATNIEDGADADGWAVNGSGAISENFHVFGGYNRQDTDGFDASLDNWRAGLGYNHGVSANTDLLARVAYEKYEADAFGFEYDTDGYSAEVGVRSALMPNLEGYALAGYEDGQDYDGDFYGRLGAQVKFNENWGINGDVKFSEGDYQWFVGPRLSF